MEPQWTKLLAMMLTEIFLILYVQHPSALYTLICPYFSLFTSTSFPTSLPTPRTLSRDQSGEGLAVGVMTGWSWDPSRVRSALLVTPGERAAETGESTPHQGVRTRLRKGKETL